MPDEVWWFLLLAVLLVLRPTIVKLMGGRLKGPKAPSPAKPDPAKLIALPGPKLAIEERIELDLIEEEDLPVLTKAKKAEHLRAEVLQRSERNMDQAAAILRDWLKQEEGGNNG